MDTNYHIFKKSVKSKGKTVHKWYFYWNDPITGIMRQKVCKGCKTQAEAYAYVSAQPSLFVEEKITIEKIARHTSLAMTDHYTRAVIPEMVKAVKPAVDAANRLFEE